MNNICPFFFNGSKKSLFRTFACAGFWGFLGPFLEKCVDICLNCYFTHFPFFSGEMRRIVELLKSSTNN